jgi:NAD(P)H-hydrate epimerase
VHHSRVPPGGRSGEAFKGSTLCADMAGPAGTTAESGSKRPTIGGYPTVTREDLLALNQRLSAAGIELSTVAETAGKNAARQLRASLLKELTDRDPEEAVITVLAGTGHKGTSALALARELCDTATVLVVLARKKTDYEGPAAASIAVLEKSAKKVYAGYNERAFDQADLIVDGLVAAGLEGTPRASVSLLIKGANFSMKPTIAMDLPTGLDATTGIRSSVVVKAEASLIVGLPKRGMLGETNRSLCGRLFLVDSGVDFRHWSAVVDQPVGDPFHGKPAVELE